MYTRFIIHIVILCYDITSTHTHTSTNADNNDTNTNTMLLHYIIVYYITTGYITLQHPGEAAEEVPEDRAVAAVVDLSLYNIYIYIYIYP